MSYDPKAGIALLFVGDREFIGAFLTALQTSRREDAEIAFDDWWFGWRNTSSAAARSREPQPDPLRRLR
jgi:hypothetical protein